MERVHTHTHTTLTSPIPVPTLLPLLLSGSSGMVGHAGEQPSSTNAYHRCLGGGRHCIGTSLRVQVSFHAHHISFSFPSIHPSSLLNLKTLPLPHHPHLSLQVLFANTSINVGWAVPKPHDGQCRSTQPAAPRNIWGGGYSTLALLFWC